MQQNDKKFRKNDKSICQFRFRLSYVDLIQHVKFDFFQTKCRKIINSMNVFFSVFVNTLILQNSH